MFNKDDDGKESYETPKSGEGNEEDASRVSIVQISNGYIYTASLVHVTSTRGEGENIEFLFMFSILVHFKHSVRYWKIIIKQKYKDMEDSSSIIHF